MSNVQPLKPDNSWYKKAIAALEEIGGGDSVTDPVEVDPDFFEQDVLFYGTVWSGWVNRGRFYVYFQFDMNGKLLDDYSGGRSDEY